MLKTPPIAIVLIYIGLTACTVPHEKKNTPKVENFKPASLVVMTKDKTDDYAHYAAGEGSYLWLPQKTSAFGIVFDLSYKQDEITLSTPSAKFTVHFATDSSALSLKAKQTLKKAAREYKGQEVTVRGYADPRYTASYNQSLSVRRAETVAGYLKKQGIEIMELKGYGERFPLETNAKSRRVTVEGGDK